MRTYDYAGFTPMMNRDERMNNIYNGSQRGFRYTLGFECLCCMRV
jgi:hypothetical protein